MYGRMEVPLHRAKGIAGLRMTWAQAGAHQLPGPGEGLCERLVPVEKPRQIGLELIQAGFQRQHARVHSRHLALRFATAEGMPLCAMAC